MHSAEGWDELLLPEIVAKNSSRAILLNRNNLTNKFMEKEIWIHFP